MKLSDLVLNFEASFGKQFWLYEVKPNMLYKDGKPTNIQDGWKYLIYAVERKMTPITVKISSSNAKPLITVEENDYIPVTFENLTVKPYMDMHNKLSFSATATNISIIKEG